MASLTSASAVLCLAETFQLGDRPELLWPVCIGAALVFTLAALPKRRGLTSAGTAALLLLLLLGQRQELVSGWRTMLYRMTDRLARCFPVPSLGSPGGEPLYALAVAALLLAWAAVWAWSGGSILPLVVTCGAVLTVCLLIVNIAPLTWLVLLTGVLLLLLLTQGSRARGAVRGNCLAWRLLPAVAALLAAVIALSPPESYQRTDWVALVQETAESGLRLPQLGSKRSVELSQLGPREETGQHVLTFRAETEISYLRGVSMGVYQDQSWSTLSTRYHTDRSGRQPQITGGRDKRRLDIRTDSQMDVLYTAYHLAATPQEGDAVNDAYWKNSGGSREYVTFYSIWTSTPRSSYDDYVYRQYLQLPEELAEPLARYCQANGLTGASAETIARHVQGAGVYDLNTPQTPEGEDFVLYFLGESHRGYCVHFASAAALLLRSQGIPARYVTGYAVSNQSGKWTDVTEDQAHSWVEYYQRGVGWRVLDPTPSDGQSREEDSQPVEGTVETPEPPEAPEPEEPTEPTEPDTPDGPDEQDASEPEEPAEPEQPNGPEEPTETAGPSREDTLESIRWWRALLVPALLLLLLAGRRWSILRCREGACAAADPNACLLAYWRWLTQLWRVGGRPMDPALRPLAEKARFSQHAASAEELAALRRAAEGEVQRLRAEPSRWKRLWHRWGLVLYR